LLNVGALVIKKKPETKRSNHEQVAFLTKTEPVYVAKYWDDLWLGVKGQSNLEIAGSLRNLFK